MVQNDGLSDKLVKLGFSAYEAKAYVALLRESPVTGYRLSQPSGVPRSAIYEVLSKLAARGAAMTVRREGRTLYAPVSANEFLGRLRRKYEEVIYSLKNDLGTLGPVSRLEYIWNIEGHERIVHKAEEMIVQAQARIHVALLPATFPALQFGLRKAVGRGVRVVICTTDKLELPGSRVVIASMPGESDEQVKERWLVLATDGESVLIGEGLSGPRARAFWTGSPLCVFVVEHFLQTALCLPQVLARPGTRLQADTGPGRSL